MSELIEQTTEEKIYASMSYLCILFIIPLFLKRDNVWLYRHAKQGLVLFAAWIIGFIVSIILPFLKFNGILQLLVALLLVISWIYLIFLLVVNIVAIVNAAQGRLWKIPILGDIATKIQL